MRSWLKRGPRRSVQTVLEILLDSRDAARDPCRPCPVKGTVSWPAPLQVETRIATSALVGTKLGYLLRSASFIKSGHRLFPFRKATFVDSFPLLSIQIQFISKIIYKKIGISPPIVTKMPLLKKY